MAPASRHCFSSSAPIARSRSSPILATTAGGVGSTSAPTRLAWGIDAHPNPLNTNVTATNLVPIHRTFQHRRDNLAHQQQPLVLGSGPRQLSLAGNWGGSDGQDGDGNGADRPPPPPRTRVGHSQCDRPPRFELRSASSQAQRHDDMTTMTGVAGLAANAVRS